MAGGAGGSVREISADDAAIQLAYAQSVIIVPGYGLAVAQAQHQVRELAELLEAKGVDVKYAIHPVAGRMPGHMNVLLAEANVPYPQLKEMDEINPDFERCDVALVVGANDVTNPAARNPGSPVSGMPILDVDHAKSIIVIKRSMGRGYAGIDNELYSNPKTGMLFADAKEGLASLTAAVKAVYAGPGGPAVLAPAASPQARRRRPRRPRHRRRRPSRPAASRRRPACVRPRTGSVAAAPARGGPGPAASLRHRRRRPRRTKRRQRASMAAVSAGVCPIRPPAANDQPESTGSTGPSEPQFPRFVRPRRRGGSRGPRPELTWTST